MNTGRKTLASLAWRCGPVTALGAGALVTVLAAGAPSAAPPASFARHILTPVGPEAPQELRLFSTPVKADSRGRVIGGQTGDPVKTIVGAEAAGTRAGLPRFTKIMFGAQYDTGRPNDSHRVDPNHPSLSSGSEHWPFRNQPFRSWPAAVDVTPDGAKLYVALPGREGYPDFRVAVVNTATRSVIRWIDLRPAGQSLATRPVGLRVSPLHPEISAAPYVVVVNEYANFASIVDTATDAVIGELETDFYAEDLVFNAAGTRLYTTDRVKNQVHVFRITAGPTFTALGTIATGNTDLDRSHPRDLDISADGNTLYVANTLGHTVAVINIANDANVLWTQNETRRLPNPRAQFPTPTEAAQIARGKQLFSTEIGAGGAGCASCHHNGDQTVGGVANDTFQDYNIHEPGVVSETTVDGDGPFQRLAADYFFIPGGQPQDEGSRQNISSRNTRHLRSFWDGVPRWLHHGFAHTVREILLGPDSPLLQPGERGFNFRTVRSDATRRVAASFLGGPAIVLPTEVPIAIADASGALGGDGRGPILVSLDAPVPVAPPGAAYPDGRLLIDQLGTNHLAPLVIVSGGQRQINPALATNHIQVIGDTHGKTSQLSQADLDALIAYVTSLQ